MQGGEWTSWEPQPVSRPGHWLEAGPLSSEQRADLSLEIPREAAASSLDGTESVPGPARHFLILFLVFFPLVLSSPQQGMGAVWCSASWEDFQRTTGDVLWDGLPPQKGAAWGLPASCSEQTFALENLSARKRLEFSLPTTTPGPPYRSLYTIGAH